MYNKKEVSAFRKDCFLKLSHLPPEYCLLQQWGLQESEVFGVLFKVHGLRRVEIKRKQILQQGKILFSLGLLLESHVSIQMAGTRLKPKLKPTELVPSIHIFLSKHRWIFRQRLQHQYQIKRGYRIGEESFWRIETKI